MVQQDGPAPFAYVLLCHADPEVVRRRAERIRELSPTCRVLVRHARGPGFLAAADVGPGIEVLDSRAPIRWGTWSTVRAVLEALAEAQRRFDPAYTVVVSGQDHPVRDLAAWEAEVRREGADALLSADPRRYDDRHTRCWHALPDAASWALRLLERATRTGAVRRLAHVHRAGDRTWVLAHARWRRAVPVPYRKGSLWMTVSRRAVHELLAAQAAVAPSFSTTLLPEEAYAHSVLAEVPGLRIVDAATTTSFFPPQGAAHPRAVELTDLAAVRAGGAAFVRKVVPGVSDAFVAAVDAVVDEERRPDEGRTDGQAVRCRASFVRADVLARRSGSSESLPP